MPDKKGNKNKKHAKVIVFDLDDTLFDSTNQPEETSKGWSIRLFDGLLPVLTSPDFKRILVTRGEAALQNKKIDALGARDYFSEIYIVATDEDKQSRFKKIVADVSADAARGAAHGSDIAADIVVVGNRIDHEIRYGNILGLHTILVKHGKHKSLVPRDTFEVPFHAIDPKDFADLNKLIETKNKTK